MTVTQDETLTIQEISPYEETDDPSVRAHIVNPPKNIHIWQPGMTSQEMVDVARMTGQFLVALCGYRWVPKHNPEKFDACDICLSIAGEMMGGV